MSAKAVTKIADRQKDDVSVLLLIRTGQQTISVGNTLLCHWLSTGWIQYYSSTRERNGHAIFLQWLLVFQSAGSE